MEDYFKTGYMVLECRFYHCKSNKDYKLISLLNILYKFVANNLANWLWPLLSKIISENQDTFVHDSNILDCIYPAQEIIR